MANNLTDTESGDKRGRLTAVALLLTLAGACIVLAIRTADEPTSTPVVADGQLAQSIAPAEAVRVDVEPTTQPATDGPRAVPTNEADTQEATVVSTPTAEQANRAGAAAIFASSLANTERLKSYKITSVQETGTLSSRVVVLQVGDSRQNKIEHNSHITESLFVDFTLYELDDAGTWHLKPVPARNLTQQDDISYFVNGLEDISTTEIERTKSTATFSVNCETHDESDIAALIAELCAEDRKVTIIVDLQTGLISEVRAEGSFETWPGRYQDGYIEATIQPVDDRERLAVPEQVDTTRFECFAETLGTSDYGEVATLLDDFLTSENQEIFNACGFARFPRGNDFVS